VAMCTDVRSASKKVVAILASRGIETNLDSVMEWASKTAALRSDRRNKNVSPLQLLCGVINGMDVPTMLVHLHFGDAVDH